MIIALIILPNDHRYVLWIFDIKRIALIAIDFH